MKWWRGRPHAWWMCPPPPPPSLRSAVPLPRFPRLEAGVTGAEPAWRHLNHSTILIFLITTGVSGAAEAPKGPVPPNGVRAILSTTSMPSLTVPNTA
jgi:hypothetical protein